MTGKQFYDWQTAGGTNDVLRLIALLEAADASWCVIGGVAVNHWSKTPMVTQDIDLVIATSDIETMVRQLEEAGFVATRHTWSINFKGQSALSIQFSTEPAYADFPSRAVAADVHGILMRVAALNDTLTGKIRACTDPSRRQSKRIKDLADMARLVETHPALWSRLPPELQKQIDKPKPGTLIGN